MGEFHDGIVQLGRVWARAAWKAQEAEIVLRFNSADVDDAATRELSRYTQSSKPIELTLPEQEPIQAVVIGFERKPAFVALHLSLAGEN